MTSDATAKSNDNKKKEVHKTETWVYGALILFAFITYYGMPHPLQPQHGEEPTIQHVFYYGWMTAISTGLGAIPLWFAPNLSSFWVGISNGKLHYLKLCNVRFIDGFLS
jgi:hypothetical protein